MPLGEMSLEEGLRGMIGEGGGLSCCALLEGGLRIMSEGQGSKGLDELESLDIRKQWRLDEGQWVGRGLSNTCHGY